MDSFKSVSSCLNKRYPHRSFSKWLSLHSTKVLLETISNQVGIEIDKLYYKECKYYYVHSVLLPYFKQWCYYKSDKTLEYVLYVYVIENKCKIGVTNNFERRHKQHLTSNPFLILKYKYVIQSKSIELLIHHRLSKFKIKDTHEWYHYSDELIHTIDQIIQTYA